MNPDAIIDAIAIIDRAMVNIVFDPGPGHTILCHAKRRLTAELTRWLTGHE